MDAPEDTSASPSPRRPRPAVAALLVVVVLAVSVGAILLVGGLVADRLSDDEPSSVSVTQPATSTSTTTSTTGPEPVVLAPPVSIDRTPTTSG